MTEPKYFSHVVPGPEVLAGIENQAVNKVVIVIVGLA